ncbi:hypothetical protein M011DRAFT_375840, partial [Sporormia fimetaria CBS 119925]
MPSAEFEELYEKVTDLATKPTNEEKLDLYAFAKIAKGEEATKAGMFDVVGKAKYNNWKKHADEGMTAEEGEKKYIELVEALIEKY